MTTGIVRQQVGNVYLLPSSGGKGPPSLIKFTSDGAIRAVRHTIPLSESAGHVYELRGQKLITAAGYDYINAGLGVTFYTPERVTGEDGAQHCNPYVHRDDHDNVKRICVRCVGIGRNGIGNWMAIDSTLHYDLGPMLAQDVLAKWRPKGQKERNWGIPYSPENIPEDVRNDPKRKTITMPGGWLLSVELGGEVIGVLAEHANRVRFATRNAETIVKRNILKKFIGRAKLDASLTVQVMAWPQADRESIDEVAKLVERASSGRVVLDAPITGTPPLKIEKQTAEVKDVDAEAAMLAGESHEDGGATDEPAAEETPPTGHDLKELRFKITQAFTNTPQEAALEALGAYGMKAIGDVNSCKDSQVLVNLLDELEGVLLYANQTIGDDEVPG